MNTADSLTPRSPLRRAFTGAVFALDRVLRRRLGVVDFAADPGCILRIAFAVHDGPPRRLAEGPLLPGDRLVDLHLWNERVPLLGPSPLVWAGAMVAATRTSLRLLARHLAGPAGDGVVALRGRWSFATAAQTAQLTRIATALGFEVMAEAPPTLAGRLHRLGENILVSLLVLARNPRGLRRDTLRRRPLTVLMARPRLDRLYGPGAAPMAAGA